MLTREEEIIIDRARRPKYTGFLENYDWKGDGANLICGDETIITIHTKDDIIIQARHQSRGCSICLAACDLWCQEIEGKPLSHLESYDLEFAKTLIPIQLSPTRLKCALLPYETINHLKKSI